MTENSMMRKKGPLVWLDMDQKELDDAYDQSVYAPNQPLLAKRRAAASKAAIERLGAPARIAYGPTEIEKLDIYKTSRPNAPINVYIHGGAWRNGQAKDFAFPAEVFINAGAHLSGCALVTDWQKDFALPSDTIKGGLLISGMYDLKPVRLSKRSEYVKFTDEIEQALSSQRHLDKLNAPIIVAYGTQETPEFQRQSREFAAAVKAVGKPVELIVGEAFNHFEMQETLGNPYGIAGRAGLKLMNLTTTLR